MKIIIVSGGFDPIHSGHIAYFNSAKSLGDKLVVALNSDNWLEKKKGKYFMPFSERKIIIENITFVDQVIDFKDDEVGSCINALEKAKKLYPNDEIFFANGGDRTKKNIPEMSVSGVNFLFGIGVGNSIFIDVKEYFPIGAWTRYIDNPHNVYLDMLLERGLLGLVTFITFLFSILSIKEKNQNFLVFIRTLIFSLMLMGMANITFRYEFALLFVILIGSYLNLSIKK